MRDFKYIKALYEVPLHTAVIIVFENCQFTRTCSKPYLSLALLTPSISISSTLSLIPAVSLRMTGYPPMLSVDSTTSLVVPAMGDTMAAGR